MGRAGVDYETIREAAEAIEAQGLAPTHERVRAQVGGGSFSTIGRHLHMWRQSRASGPAGSTAPLPDAISQAAQGIWSRLHEASEAKFAAAEAQFAEQLLRQEQDAEAAQTAAQALFDGKMAELERSLVDHKRENAQLTAALSQLRVREQSVSEALRAAELARADAEGERDALQAGLEDLRRSLQQAHAQVAAREEEATAARRVNEEILTEHVGQARREHEEVAEGLASLLKLRGDVAALARAQQQHVTLTRDLSASLPNLIRRVEQDGAALRETIAQTTKAGHDALATWLSALLDKAESTQEKRATEQFQALLQERADTTSRLEKVIVDAMGQAFEEAQKRRD